MIEIIPNWHPVFVHFTVALLSIAVLLSLVTQFMSPSKIREQWQLVAQWNLWLGAGITVFTVAAGVVAYNTVAHDTPSHEAMTEHRNWALVTAALFFALAIWSWLRARAAKPMSGVFLIGLLIGGGLLASTAWHGGEAVYRFGLGVMSLPKADDHNHAAAGHEHAVGADGHAHAAGHGHESIPAMQKDNLEDCELPEKGETAQSQDISHDDGHVHAHTDAAPDAAEAGHLNHEH